MGTVYSIRYPLVLGLCLLILSACQTTPDEEEVYNPEEQGVAERVRHYQGEVAKSPENPELYYRLGNALLDMGRNHDAYVAYQKAVQLKPDYADAYANLGLTLRKMGNLKAATGAYARAIDINPADKQTLSNLAIVSELMEDWVRMRWCYEKLYALEPNNLDYADAYVALLYGLEEYTEAIPVYQRLIEADRDVAANTYRMGYCYFSLKQADQAIATWERARTLAPENASVNQGLVSAYVAAGDGAAAQAAASRCQSLGIRLDPVILQSVEALVVGQP